MLNQSRKNYPIADFTLRRTSLRYFPHNLEHRLDRRHLHHHRRHRRCPRPPGYTLDGMHQCCALDDIPGDCVLDGTNLRFPLDDNQKDWLKGDNYTELMRDENRECFVVHGSHRGRIEDDSNTVQAGDGGRGGCV